MSARTVGVVIVAAASLSVYSPAVMARRTGSCAGDHGAFTDVLCPGDALGPNQYLVNGIYQLIYANGALDVFDKSDYDNPVWVRHLFSGMENPGWVKYSENPGYGLMSLVNYNSSAQVNFDSYLNAEAVFEPYRRDIDVDPLGTGEHFLRLESDGTVRWYDKGGDRCVAAFLDFVFFSAHNCG